MYSTSEVAEMLNVTRRDVSYHCKRLGIKKIGGVYMLTKNDIEKIKNRSNERLNLWKLETNMWRTENEY